MVFLGVNYLWRGIIHSRLEDSLKPPRIAPKMSQGHFFIVLVDFLSRNIPNLIDFKSPKKSFPLNFHGETP